VDVEQSYKLGAEAVKLAIAGRNAVMPVIERVSNKPYRWRIGVAKLADVANKEKMMPRDFITADGFHITAKCRTYISPLIQGEAPPPYRNGLPDYVKLRNVAVPKKLPEFKV
jgi:6-phosphofructokinase 1